MGKPYISPSFSVIYMAVPFSICQNFLSMKIRQVHLVSSLDSDGIDDLFGRLKFL